MQPVELFSKVLNRIIELGNVHIERNYHTAGDGLAKEGGTIKVSLTAQVEQQHNGAYVEHIDQWPKHAEDEYLFTLRLSKQIASIDKITVLCIFTVENLCDFYARKVL